MFIFTNFDPFTLFRHFSQNCAQSCYKGLIVPRLAVSSEKHVCGLVDKAHFPTSGRILLVI